MIHGTTDHFPLPRHAADGTYEPAIVLLEFRHLLRPPVDAPTMCDVVKAILLGDDQ